jgi:hypothetical protein
VGFPIVYEVEYLMTLIIQDLGGKCVKCTYEEVLLSCQVVELYVLKGGIYITGFSRLRTY